MRDYHSARRDCHALLALAEETAEGGERLAKDAKAILAGVDKAEAAERSAEREAFGRAFAYSHAAIPPQCVFKGCSMRRNVCVGVGAGVLGSRCPTMTQGTAA